MMTPTIDELDYDNSLPDTLPATDEARKKAQDEEIDSLLDGWDPPTIKVKRSTLNLKELSMRRMTNAQYRWRILLSVLGFDQQVKEDNNDLTPAAIILIGILSIVVTVIIFFVLKWF